MKSTLVSMWGTYSFVCCVCGATSFRLYLWDILVCICPGFHSSVAFTTSLLTLAKISKCTQELSFIFLGAFHTPGIRQCWDQTRSWVWHAQCLPRNRTLSFSERFRYACSTDISFPIVLCVDAEENDKSAARLLVLLVSISPPLPSPGCSVPPVRRGTHRTSVRRGTHRASS